MEEIYEKSVQVNNKLEKECKLSREKIEELEKDKMFR